MFFRAWDFLSVFQGNEDRWISTFWRKRRFQLSLPPDGIINQSHRLKKINPFGLYPSPPQSPRPLPEMRQGPGKANGSYPFTCWIPASAGMARNGMLDSRLHGNDEKLHGGFPPAREWRYVGKLACALKNRHLLSPRKASGFERLPCIINGNLFIFYFSGLRGPLLHNPDAPFQNAPTGGQQYAGEPLPWHRQYC